MTVVDVRTFLLNSASAFRVRYMFYISNWRLAFTSEFYIFICFSIM